TNSWFFRIQTGEAVFQFELQQFGVNRARERAMADDLAVSPRFSQGMCTPLDSLRAGRPERGGQDLAGPQRNSQTLWPRCLLRVNTRMRVAPTGCNRSSATAQALNPW